jgi:hypothetical protein
MLQSRGVLRFHGQLSSFEASVERAGVALACACASAASIKTGLVNTGPSKVGPIDPAVIRARYQGLLDPRYFAQMRFLLCTTAVSALAVLLLILL